MSHEPLDPFSTAAVLAEVNELHDREAGELRAEITRLTNENRLAEATITLLRADLAATQRDDDLHPTGRCRCGGEGRCAWCLMNTIREERDALLLERRRTLAAEMPGADDAAFDGTGWKSATEGRPYWHHPSGWVVRRDAHGFVVAEGRHEAERSSIIYPTLFAGMKAAVPGSV